MNCLPICSLMANNTEATMVNGDELEKVFVKDPTFAWLPATVLEADGADRVRVRVQLPPDWAGTTLLPKKTATADGIERWVDLNDYHNHELPRQNGRAVRDIAELAYLHEAAILYQVKARHVARQPYTRVGEIIIAVNPCQWIDDLYTPNLQRLYAKHFVWQVPLADKPEEKKEENIISTSSTSFESFYDRLGHEPHIYEVSASAYRGLTLDGRNQTILVSGESGGGKTETVKLVLRHLSIIDMAALCDDMSPKNKLNEDMINYVIKSSPVFEAFGNAKTCSNHNSSRFGKVTRLHFALGDVGMYSLAGSSFVTYLLETSRVAFHSPGERNFHIFYQLLSTSSSFKAKHLGEEWADATADDFHYLGGSTSSGAPALTDEAIWEDTLAALQSFEWRDDSLSMLLRGLGIVLRLGNLSFGEISEGEARIETRNELGMLAKIIGIPVEDIEKAMTRRALKTRQDELSVPLSCETAKECCDAFAKKIYCRIFASVVRAINGQTAPTDGENDHGNISLVDIFGFECFQVNRFEQLCINYTNEVLQNKYVKDNLQRYKAEYEREGLTLFDMKQFDNTDILELFEGSKGLINALTEESVLPNGNNASFVFKVKTTHRDNERLVSEKLQMKTEFGIQHFAGQVVYDASEFIERNSDKLPDSLLQLATRSSNLLVALEFAELARVQAASDSHDNSRKVKLTTVMERFRSQLRALVDEMSETQIRYIRCIKPNEMMKPIVIDHSTIMRQLKCAGLVTAIEITRETFPNKLSFNAVEERFKCLLGSEKLKMMENMEPEEKCQFMMAALFAPEIKKFHASNFTMPYACGKTKVFYRAGSLELLETARHEFLSAAASRLQAWVRMNKVRCEFRRLQQAAIVIQTAMRRARAMSTFRKHIKAVIRIQTGVSSRRQRVREQRCDMNDDGLSSVDRIIRVQAIVRAKQVRDHLMIQRGAALCIQHWYRQSSNKARRHQQDLTEDRQDEPKMIIPTKTQKNSFRKGPQVVHLSSQGNVRRRAATIIQTWRRAQRDRVNYNCLKASVMCLQARFKLMKALGRDFRLTATFDVPDVIEFRSAATDSIHDLDSDLEGALVINENNEQSRFVNREQDLIEERLMREINDEKLKVIALEREIAQMRSDAEQHAQEIECDFEERVVGYEEEVLLLKEQIKELELAKAKQEEDMQTTDEAHKKNIQRLQFEIQKIQGSHRDYLDKIMALLDDTEMAQKLQTSRISEELEAIKRERDSQVKSLKEEIKLLRSIGFGSTKRQSELSEKAQRLSRKLYAILSPENILLVVKEALQQHQGTTQLYIEDRLSSKARNMISYLEEIVSVAEYEERDWKIKCLAIEDQVGKLQQQLVCAYEEIEYSKSAAPYM